MEGSGAGKLPTWLITIVGSNRRGKPIKKKLTYVSPTKEHAYQYGLKAYLASRRMHNLQQVTCEVVKEKHE